MVGITGKWGDLEYYEIGFNFFFVFFFFRVRIFSIKKLKPLAILKYHNKSIQSLSFCQKTNLLASSSSDGKISIWDIYNN